MGQNNYPQPPIFCDGNPTSLNLRGTRGQFAYDESDNYKQYVWAPDGAWHVLGGGGGGLPPGGTTGQALVKLSNANDDVAFGQTVALQVSYNNSNSGYSATNVQDAIDEQSFLVLPIISGANAVRPGIPCVTDGIGGATFRADAGLVNGTQFLTTGAAPVACDPNVHCTTVTTGGTQGTEVVTLGAIGTPLPTSEVGGQHVVKLHTHTDPLDVLSVDITHIVNADGSPLTSILLDAVDEWVLFESWDEFVWRVVRATPGVVT